jgi:hypothetical protein
MADKDEGKGWGTGKILAVIIPLCVAVNGFSSQLSSLGSAVTSAIPK